MKRKTIILFSIVLITILSIILGENTFSYARVTTNDPTVESGGEVKITVSTTMAVSCFKIQLTDVGGLTFKSASKNSNFDNGSSNGSTINGATTGQPSTTLATYIFTAPEVTETKKYTVKFSITGMDNETDTTSTSTVTVKAKEQTPVQPENPTTPETPSTPETPTTPTTPTVTEPKFANANKTMYATSDINLRASWSTSSSATKITKGTELTVTGTSTEKVNGYVWYRVSYNGATKYVASNLLTSTKPEEEEKSNNANLKSLIIENQELVPEFSSSTTSYTMQVANNVTKLEIKAEAEDAKAKVTVQGNEELKDGENTVTISVSAEDGTVKIYEIKVTRLLKAVLGLQSLKIKDTNIETMFKPEIYNYEIEVKEVTKLEIEAIASEENATIEILGNEDLQEGENLITIIVSSQEGEEKVTYQIKANKLALEVKPTTINQIDSKIYMYAAIGVVLVIALIIVIVYTIKNRNQEEYEYTDNIEELPQRKEEQVLEETQEINDINKEEMNIEEEKKEEKKTKIDYFLENEEETPKRKKGKHF